MIDYKHLDYRRKHGVIKLEEQRWPDEEGEIILSASKNGYQFTSISLLLSEQKKVVELLTEHIERVEVRK